MIDTSHINLRRRPNAPSMKRVARVLIGAAFISSIFIALVVFLCSALPALMGFRTMVVTGGSMEPSIRTGDAVVLKPAPPGTVDVGDVITYPSGEGQRLNTHRVTAITEIQGRTYYQTKGDVNSSPDPDLTIAETVAGKVVSTLPKAGYLLGFATTLLGRALIFGFPLLILLAKEVSTLRQYRTSST